MSSDLLQPFQIITELAVHTVGQYLAVFAIHDIALSVKEPSWDFVLRWALDDGYDSLEFFGGEFAGAGMSRFLVFGPNTLRRMKVQSFQTYRLLRSTSAFLHTKLLYRRPTPLIFVNAYMTFCLPSTCKVSVSALPPRIYPPPGRSRPGIS